MPAVRSLIPVLAAAAAALLFGACGGGGGGGNGGGGGAPTPEPPALPADSSSLASGATPFATGCDGVASSGTVFGNAEVEPHIAIDPRDANHLVGVWQQDRWSSGGARGLLTVLSFDGGVTWTPRMVPFSRCSGGNAGNGGDYERATDPWVSIAPDGTVHQAALAFSGGSFTPGSANAILASRSTDGGRTWSAPATLIRDGGDFFNDKESITADPIDARLVYAVWDRLDATGHGPSWFARSTNGGLTWEAARPIHDPGEGNQTINNQVVVLPDGVLVNFFTRFVRAADGSATASLAVIRSADKGATWGAPVAIATVQALGTRDPETLTPIRDGANLGSIAAGRDGSLAVAWQDARFSGGARDGIAFSRSTDGGLTWSVPARINAAPAVQAFVPTVHIRADGTIGVTYYDLRNNTADPATLSTDHWLLRSSDGLTWREAHVAGPFDLALAPNARGLFLGDYQGLTSAGNVFVPFFAQTGTGATNNRTDIFAARMVTAIAAAKAAARAGATADRSAVDRAETLVQAQPADALPASSELAARLTESVQRTAARRRRGTDE
jgi:hypothetical protein